MRIRLGLASGAAVVFAACASGSAPVRDPMAGEEAAATKPSGTRLRVNPVLPAEQPAPVIEEPAAPIEKGEEVTVTAQRGDLWKGGLDAYLKALSDTSCPPGSTVTAGEAAAITAKPVPLQAINPSRKKIGEITFVAGFHLTSPDKRFGGLSGLDLLDNGNLLAVSDVGDLVWIDLAPDGLTPVSARIAPMHDAAGRVLSGKTDADSEGLAINGGMALVSFERNHRVLGFDLGRCGASARGAPIVFGPFGEPLPQAFGDAEIAVGENEGAEALAVTSDWYLFTGLETKVGDLSPLSARPIEAPPDFNLHVGVEMPPFVGLDVIPAPQGGGSVRAFELHRSFSALAGNAITISETDFSRFLDQKRLQRRIEGEIDERARYRYVETGWRTLAELNLLVTIDNFEGIAAKELPDGRVRLYIISDDNFSATQRTLLMIFEVPKPVRR